MDDNEKINLFVSYAHDDADCAAFTDFKKYIIDADQLSNCVNPWIDGEIKLGTKWNEEIKQNLEKADIVILVISQAFLNSKYIKTELKIAFEKELKGTCRVIPLFFESLTLTEDYKFLENQGYPSGPKKIKDLATEIKRGNAFSEFQRKILDIVQDIINNRKKKAARNLDQSENISNLKLDHNSVITERANQPERVKNDCKFFAIIIVNYEYQFMPEKNIPNIEANLNALEDIFINDVKIPNENVRILPNKNSYDLLEDLGNIIEGFPEDATLFVYYSGHGIPDSDDFFWATRNTKLKETKDEINTGTAYETSKIRKLLERSGLKQKILVVDCCYAAEFLEGSQSMTIDGYMQQKVNLSDTFYFFSSEANQESMYPVNKPEEATYFTQALVKAFKDEITEGASEIKIGNIYKRTASILGQFRRNNSKVPSPIKQPKDNSLDNIILFSNPNKPGKPAIESQTIRAAEINDISDVPNSFEAAFEMERNELNEKFKRTSILEERKEIAKQNSELLRLSVQHAEINSIQNRNERVLRKAQLAEEAVEFQYIARTLMEQSQTELVRATPKK